MNAFLFLSLMVIAHPQQPMTPVKSPLVATMICAKDSDTAADKSCAAPEKTVGADETITVAQAER